MEDPLRDVTSCIDFHFNINHIARQQHRAATPGIHPARASQIMATDEKPCLLLKLSAELRNGIYELVLPTEDFIDIRMESQPAIARTCRQIREECIQIYYGRSNFEFVTASAQDDALDGMANWLERIGSDHCRALRTIKIKTGVPNGLLLNDATNPETPWKIMMERMKKLGVTKAIRIEVELCAEPFKPLFVQMWTHDSAAKALGVGVQESRARHFSDYIKYSAIKYLGWDGCSDPDCNGDLHQSVVTPYHLGKLAWCAVKADSLLYAGRPEIPRRRKRNGEEDSD
ncbi:hypothetical protein LTR17_005404 [Elasticomyces elasticus]|nr:hypothetical protein LTR17_005404 [Elasticomyces elasticus]